MTVAKTAILSLDCTEPAELAEFYAALLGAEARPGQGNDFVEVVGDHGVHIAIRRDLGYAPPSWPRPEDSQQAHLRIRVAPADMDAAEREAVDLGATPVDAKNNGGARDTRLFADPAGHSFALTTI